MLTSNELAVLADLPIRWTLAQRTRFPREYVRCQSLRDRGFLAITDDTGDGERVASITEAGALSIALAEWVRAFLDRPTDAARNALRELVGM